MNPEKCQTCAVMISWSMLSIEKKSSVDNEDTSTISQNLSGSLSKPQNFIGDGLICEDSTWQQSPHHLKFLPLHYEVKSWHHAKFQLFLTYFTISKILETKKSIFEVVTHNYFAYFPFKFFLHKASTCGEYRK